MNLKSHRIVSNVVADIIESLIDIKIDRDMLELGAVYPDMNFTTRLKIHNLKQVFKNYQLQVDSFIVFNKNKWGVSFALGMLSHYVCDTFCLMHNMKMRTLNDFRKHRRYENKLSDEIENYKLDDTALNKVKESFYLSIDFNLDSFLKANKEEYLENVDFDVFDNQFIKDIEYSIFCSAIVMLGFISDLEKAECPAVQVLHV